MFKKKNIRKLTASERRLLEEKIKVATMLEDEISDEEIDAIKQSAYEEFMNYQEYRVQCNEKRRITATHMVAVIVVAIILLVAPVIYSIVLPVTISKADGVMRRVAIWINDQFHIGIDISGPDPVSLEEVSASDPCEEEIYYTVSEAAQHSSLPIVFLEESDTVKLDSIHIMKDELSSNVVVTYNVGNASINIFITPASDAETVHIHHTTAEIETAFGTIYIWGENDGSGALMVYRNCSVEIYSNLSFDALLTHCEKISVIN